MNFYSANNNYNMLYNNMIDGKLLLQKYYNATTLKYVIDRHLHFTAEIRYAYVQSIIYFNIIIM